MAFWNETLQLFLQNLSGTSWMEYIAASTGLISVWFARNRNILVYPSGIISVLLYVYLMFQIGFYANSLINFIYFIMSIYGWYYWNKKRTESNDFVPEKVSKTEWKYYSFVLIALLILMYFLLKATTDNPYYFWDALTTSIFIIAMWMLATRKTVNWLAWIAGDLICVPLFLIQGMVLTSFQYFIFLFIAVSGYFSWGKLRIKSETC